MGANQSSPPSLPSTTEWLDSNDEPVFLIPPTSDFSHRQIQILSDTGQSVNVPFGIDEVGAHRQRGKRIKVFSSSSSCSIDCSSLNLLLQENDIFLNFTYSKIVRYNQN